MMKALLVLFALATFSSARALLAQENGAADVPQTIHFEGYVQPSREAELSPLVDNVVTRIAFHAGQYVHEGDLLFEFGKKGPFIEMRLSETALKDAKAQRMLADAELGRKTELYLKDLIPEAELQLAQVNRDLAEIAAERAGLAYEGAQLAYSFTELHAPFSGIISQPQVKQYQYLSTERRGDETLAILSDIDPVYVVVKVPYEEFIKRSQIFESDAEAFEGLSLSLQMPDGQLYPYEGHYFGGAFTVNPKTQLMDIWAEFPNPDLLLRPGAKVTVISSLRN
ncbi:MULTISPECIES: efflux RND transporter periplasmic adaptor subunit [unclassified Ruegeria]|uniref:efflux RND transporter periplasmic adaptor subunit n=1 Tax=unclassified Ruegeria TaxID=2625375 RepID=UPI001489D426|nr:MULTISPECIES: efflux RND transporter periplasmic adaptor subunit [unclassified Ruegeria]